MSFKRFESEDFLVSIDSVTAGAFTGDASVFGTTVVTSSAQTTGTSGQYYTSVQRVAAGEDQFSIAFGDSNGSGSALYDAGIDGKSPSSTVFGQWQNIVLGDENNTFTFGGITPVSQSIIALTFNRARYKGSLFPGTFNLGLSGSTFIQLTDNSKDVSSVEFNEAGRVFQLVSGSNGTATGTPAGATVGMTKSGSYGLFLPDIGTVLLNTSALKLGTADGGVMHSGAYIFNFSSNTNGLNNQKFANAISESCRKNTADTTNSGSIVLNSLDNVSSDYIFIRARNAEFNYSENPSFISGSTGEVLYDAFINAPQTFITTIGLYNDSNELVATAKLSKPLKKDFTKEALIRVKLDF
jgi:hypothetical protein|tara:strand:+ start:1437 stop:2498 length:1062 start_codon:yes stop_codon:yes gene_type:complete